MTALKDRVGDRYGKLVVQELVGFQVSQSGKRKIIWRCACDCGGTTDVAGDNLQSGNTTSCWCTRRAQASLNRTTHGYAVGNGTREYGSWHAMRDRCLNEKSKDFPNYGGRGIRICSQWGSFETFLADMGRRPSQRHTLERENVNGDYKPGNVRWALPKEQARNRRYHQWVEFEGERLPLSVAAERAGLPEYVLRDRLKRGTPLFAPYVPKRRQGLQP